MKPARHVWFQQLFRSALHEFSISDVELQQLHIQTDSTNTQIYRGNLYLGQRVATAHLS